MRSSTNCPFAVGAIALAVATACSTSTAENTGQGGSAGDATIAAGPSSIAGDSGTDDATVGAATTGTTTSGGAATAGIVTTAPNGPPAWSDCLPHGTVTTCDDYCAAVGSKCSNTCVSPYTGKPAGALTFGNATCTYFTAGYTSACEGDIYPYKANRCCCGI